MCGIIGYIGRRPALDVLIDGLKRMEYRGYDSAGVAYFKEDALKMVKTRGRIAVLENLLDKTDISFCGIGHTRWATHGAPSDSNAHPHKSGRISVVHNGIIENYAELKKQLEKEGHIFLSETDTEVLPHLIEEYYEGDLVGAVRKVLKRVKGAYALGIVSSDRPDRLVAVRKDSPLLIGLGEGENFIASDMTAILKYTRDYYLLEEGEIAQISKDEVKIYDENGKEIIKERKHAEWDIESAEKCGYPHFMLKEIYETPTVLRNIANKYLVEGDIVFDDSSNFNRLLGKINRIVIVACGSANHVGQVAKYIIESICGVEVSVEAASEFRYRSPVLREGDMVLAISQSGETADTLAAMRLAKKRGFPLLAVVNVLGSSVAREADIMLYTAAGPEIAVATTKAFSAQLAVMYLLAFQLALVKGRITAEEQAKLIGEFKLLPTLCEEFLSDLEPCKAAAKELSKAADIFFIGRGLDYAISLEGSLKLKEISYIHSEAFTAGELKHGPISLIDKFSPTIATATQKSLLEKMLSNICEIRSREGDVITLCRKRDAEVFAGVSKVIELSDFSDMFMPSLSVLALQAIAYYVALEKKCDIDKPRNLAKSVTVE